MPLHISFVALPAGSQCEEPASLLLLLEEFVKLFKEDRHTSFIFMSLFLSVVAAVNLILNILISNKKITLFYFKNIYIQRELP